MLFWIMAAINVAVGCTCFCIGAAMGRVSVSDARVIDDFQRWRDELADPSW